MILNIPNRPFCTKSKGVNSKDLGFIQYRARKKCPIGAANAQFIGYQVSGVRKYRNLNTQLVAAEVQHR